MSRFCDLNCAASRVSPRSSKSSAIRLPVWAIGFSALGGEPAVENRAYLINGYYQVLPCSLGTVSFPQPHSCIKASGSDGFPIRTIGYSVNWTGMPFEGSNGSAISFP